MIFFIAYHYFTWLVLLVHGNMHLPKTEVCRCVYRHTSLIKGIFEQDFYTAVPFKAHVLLWQEYKNVKQKWNRLFWCAFPTARAVNKMYLKHIWWSNWKLYQHWNYKQYKHHIIDIACQQKGKENRFHFPIFIYLFLKLQKLHRNYFETLFWKKLYLGKK